MRGRRRKRGNVFCFVDEYYFILQLIFRSGAPGVDSEQEPGVQTDGGQLQAAHGQQPEQRGRHGRDQGPRVGPRCRGLCRVTVFCFAECVLAASGWERGVRWRARGRIACTSYKESWGSHTLQAISDAMTMS